MLRWRVRTCAGSKGKRTGSAGVWAPALGRLALRVLRLRTAGERHVVFSPARPCGAMAVAGRARALAAFRRGIPRGFGPETGPPCIHDADAAG